jgi:excisionase family DNA binding protein
MSRKRPTANLPDPDDGAKDAPMPIEARSLDLPGDLLTYEDAGRLLGKSATTIRRMIDRGELEAITVGGHPRILRPIVYRYLERQQRHPRDGEA